METGIIIVALYVIAVVCFILLIRKIPLYLAISIAVLYAVYLAFGCSLSVIYVGLETSLNVAGEVALCLMVAFLFFSPIAFARIYIKKQKNNA